MLGFIPTDKSLPNATSKHRSQKHGSLGQSLPFTTLFLRAPPRSSSFSAPLKSYTWGPNTGGGDIQKAPDSSLCTHRSVWMSQALVCLCVFFKSGNQLMLQLGAGLLSTAACEFGACAATGDLPSIASDLYRSGNPYRNGHETSRESTARKQT